MQPEFSHKAAQNETQLDWNSGTHFLVTAFVWVLFSQVLHDPLSRLALNEYSGFSTLTIEVNDAKFYPVYPIIQAVLF